jgi:hypothetical protein
MTALVAKSSHARAFSGFDLSDQLATFLPANVRPLQ